MFTRLLQIYVGFARRLVSNDFPCNQFFSIFRHPDISHVCYFRTKYTFIYRNISLRNLAKKILCVLLEFNMRTTIALTRKETADNEKEHIPLKYADTDHHTHGFVHALFYFPRVVRCRFLHMDGYHFREGSIITFHTLTLAIFETSLSVHKPLLLPA